MKTIILGMHEQARAEHGRDIDVEVDGEIFGIVRLQLPQYLCINLAHLLTQSWHPHPECAGWRRSVAGDHWLQLY